MLKHLSIENYALIQSVSLTFGPGFTVITGETGAGKSILLGALGLLLGNRAETQVLFDKEKKCVVEAVFEISRPEVSRILADNDLDEAEDGTLLLRREITAAGKSRAFVNDTPCSLPVLKALSAYLVDIHSQHKTMDMVRPSFLLEIVDGYIPAEKRVVAEYAPLYKRYVRVQADLEALVTARQAWEREQDYWRFLYEELDAMQLQAGEQAELEAVLSQQQHAEQIKEAMEAAQAAWTQGEEAMEARLTQTVRQLKKIAAYHSGLQAALPRWESALIELNDLQGDLRNWSGALEFSPAEKAATEERLSRIYALESKHRVQTVEELITLRDQTAQRLQAEDGRAEEQQRLEAEAAELKAALEALAVRWREARLEAGRRLMEKTQEALADLAMPDATLVLQWDAEADFTPRGKDRVRLLFNANRGGVPAELGKVASGGELSRLMLAIKSVIHENSLIHCLILDEIDTGVSGETAAKMAVMMQRMAQYMQVVSITHLPQIAAKANAHYRVSKQVAGDRSLSRIEPLDAGAHRNAIAAMLSDGTPTKEALEAADVLLEKGLYERGS